MYYSNQIYNFNIIPINNLLDSQLFYINKSTNCLAFNINSDTYAQETSIPGYHLINITISDNLGGVDSALAKIYITNSCNQIIYLITDQISQTIRDNLQSYIKLIFFLNFLKLSSMTFLYPKIQLFARLVLIVIIYKHTNRSW